MTTILFLPYADTDYRWLRLGEDGVVARGEGVPAADGPVVAVAPADAVTLHWAALPNRSPAQSVAAARILASEASASPTADLHVAVGREDADERPIGVVSVADMRGWLASMAAVGIDPQAVLPAPMLLPRPDSGYLRGEIGGQGVVRGAVAGFADEARLTELVTGGVAPTVVPRDEVDAAIVAAVAAPALDLRQGPFARRRRFALDWPLIRRLARLALAILAMTLIITLVRIAKYGFAADAVEARTEQVARQGLPRGETVGNADRQLDERLSRLRGPGLGFSRTAAVLFAAIQAVEGSEATALAFEPNGALRATVSAAGEGQANALKQRIEAAGFRVAAGTFQAVGGRVTGELTMTPR